MVNDLVRKSRSYRRFDQSYLIDRAALRELVDLARMSPSAANLQPLKYILSYEPTQNALIFDHLAWAGYLKDWPGPAEGQRPSAYIIILGDTGISKTFGCDHGIAAQSILLGAADRGLGGCMIGSINRDALRKKLDIDDHLQILLVIALGRPAERVVLEDMTPQTGIEYYRDQQDVHHVPKRPLDQIIIKPCRV